jgi:recombinational DNA repair protein (RecF pathway)
LYYFEVGSGIREYTAESAAPGVAGVIRGEQLLAMAHHNFIDQEVLKSAKKISRQALRQLLGPRPLKSRELFR